MKLNNVKLNKGKILSSINYNVDLSEDEYEFLKKLKPNRSEQIDEFLSGLTFYGIALNVPGKILALKYKALDFRKEDNVCMIHFTILNGWGSGIMYNIFEYGKAFSLNKEDLI